MRRVCVLLALAAVSWNLVLGSGGPACGADKDPTLTAEQKEKLAEAESLNARAVKLYQEGKSRDAIPLAKQVLAIRKEVLGLKHPDTATSLNNLGMFLQSMGEYAAARPYYEQALAIRKEVLGLKHPDTATSLSSMGYLLQSMGDDAAARPYYEQALAIYKEVLGPKHPLTATSLNKMGYLLLAMGDYAAARPYYEQALAIRKEVLGPKHPDTATSLNNIGYLLLAMGDYAAARPYYEQALAIRKEALGPKHPDTAGSLNNLGYLLLAMGDYAAARPYYEQALAIYKEVLGPKHPHTAGSLNNLGYLLLAMGDYAAARPYYEQALAIRKEVLGPKHPDTAGSLNNLGYLLLAMGDYAAARPYYEQALAIRKEVLGPKHPDTATSLNNLGYLLQSMGDYAAARPYYEQALAIYKEVLGPKHPHTATSFNNMGSLLRSMGDYAAARPYYEQALAIRKEVLGPKHPDTAGSLNNLGALLQSEGDFAAARPYYEQALAIHQEVLGRKHPDTATSLGNLGVLLYSMGDYAAARPYHEQALAINKEVLGPMHPGTALSLSNLSVLFTATDQWQEASKNMDEARRVVRRHVARVLPGLVAREQLKFLTQTDENSFHWALSMGLLRSEDQSIVDLSAAWVANGKAVAQEALAEQALAARDTRDPALADTVRKLLNVRRQLASLSLSSPKLGKEDVYRADLGRLENQEEELYKQVAQARGQQVQEDPWVALDQVQRALPANGVLVEIARFRVFNFHAKGKEPKWQAAHYVAWVIPPTGEGSVKVVDLGLAEPIEAAVQDWRKDWRQAQKHAADEDEARQSLEELTRLLYQPLAKHLAAKKQWLLSPDGALWLVPWAALTLPGGQYAIEEHELTYLVSGRDLVRSPAAQQNTTTAVVMADPDYDLDLSQRDEAASAEPRDQKAAVDVQVPPSASYASSLPKAKRLPGTAEEAKAIEPNLGRYAKKDPQVYLDRRALEGEFKAVKHPLVIVLSTHGFFMPDQEVKPVEQLAIAGEQRRDLPALTTSGKPLENPLVRCGLLLAGCNSRQQGNAPAGDDGVLTGLEIVGTDLRGTELVVLSACETGVGQVRIGEGVAGLRQAFQLAGARAVMATLWKIPDRETATLMSTMFSNLAAGQCKSQALRNAQLALVKDRRARQGGAHPFYWAAFTLTGQ